MNQKIKSPFRGVAHKIVYVKEWVEKQGEEEFLRRDVMYACGKQIRTVIEKKFAVPDPGWPAGMRMCKLCARLK